MRENWEVDDGVGETSRGDRVGEVGISGDLCATYRGIFEGVLSAIDIEAPVSITAFCDCTLLFSPRFASPFALSERSSANASATVVSCFACSIALIDGGVGVGDSRRDLRAI